MRYYAFEHNGGCWSLGDCGDALAANEIAEDLGMDYVFVMSADEILEIADKIREAVAEDDLDSLS